MAVITAAGIAAGVGAALAAQAGTVLAVIIGQTIAPALAPIAQGSQQLAFRVKPNTLLAVAEAVELRYRGLMSENDYGDELVRMGFNKERQDWLYSVAEKLIPVMDDIHLWRRGKLSKAMLITRAEAQGYTAERLQNLLDVSEVIPTATDIISFAVREVYSPEIAEAFGQYEGLDEVYGLAEKDITAVGMRKDTFGKYWAAHWRLPGVEQGYEMLHREAITKDQLDKLMVALDIMPFWRKPLLDISYKPYTRVDVRRMYRVGVLDEAAVLRAYKDLGFDDKKSAKMTAFTIAYESSPTEEDMTEDEKQVAKNRDLTRADVCRGYRLKLIAEADATTLLSGLGYGKEEVEFYIAREDYLEEEEATDKYLKWFHEAYTKEIWDKITTEAKLGELNLPSEYTNYLMELWMLEKEVRVNMPTKSELLGFLKKGIIDTETCIGELRKHRYPDRYIDWYMATVEAA